MYKGKIFKNGRSQAVRLPKECRFSGAEVRVAKLGDAVILFPVGKGWDLLEKSLSDFTPDFMSDRNQPKIVDARERL